jgi:sialate O-acetylesterase
MLRDAHEHDSIFRPGAAAGLLPACRKLAIKLERHMVLQRDRPIHMPDPEKVRREAARPPATALETGRLPASRWRRRAVHTVTGGNEIALDDVLVGDVWFASGQSNMEMPLKGFGGAPLKNSAEEIAHANQPQIRLLHIPTKAADFPLRNADASWTVCSPGNGRQASPPWPTSSDATWRRASTFPSA